MKPHLLCGLIRLGFRQECLRLLPRQALRAFSDSAPVPNELLKEWSLEVGPFIKIKCHLHCHISIKPLDPHAFPGADRAFISVHGTSHEILDSFHVHYDGQSQELSIVSDESSRNVSVELKTPIKSDLQVVTQGKGGVKIHNMESDVCQVETESGQCVLHSIKSHKVQVRSRGGSVTTLGTIHGDIDISTAGDSNVDIRKIQGTAMSLSTEHGPLKVKAIYAESSSVASSSGKIHIGHLHGEAHVRSDTGDVLIDSSNGCLRVDTVTGSIDAYVGQTGTAELHTKQGAVCVRVPSSIKAAVELRGTSVKISPEISQKTERHSTEGNTEVTAQLNGGTREESWIRVTADRGTVSLKTQSWFETLGLGS